MTRNAVPGLRKNHAPGQVRGSNSSPEFTINEVSESAEEKSQRHERSDEITDGKNRFLVSPRKIKERKDDADKPAVRTHSALPDREDFKRMAQIVFRLIKQHKAQAAADDHADHTDKE